MTAYLYKHFLIADRDCTNLSVKKLLDNNKCGLGIPKPFEYRSKDDKVILCFPNLLTTQSGIQVLGATNFVPPGSQEGVLQLLCDGTNVKVSSCIFGGNTQAYKHLGLFKEYLQFIVEQSKPGTIITLYWEPKLINDSTRNLIVKQGLLTNQSTLSHQLKAKSSVSFGFGSSSGTGFGQNTTFAPTPSQNLGASTSIPTFSFGGGGSTFGSKATFGGGGSTFGGGGSTFGGGSFSWK